MSDNWVVQHLINTLNTWNEKLGEVWQLLTTSPAAFKGGGIWKVILTINGSLQAVGLERRAITFPKNGIRVMMDLIESAFVELNPLEKRGGTI